MKGAATHKEGPRDYEGCDCANVHQLNLELQESNITLIPVFLAVFLITIAYYPLSSFVVPCNLILW